MNDPNDMAPIEARLLAVEAQQLIYLARQKTLEAMVIALHADNDSARDKMLRDSFEKNALAAEEALLKTGADFDPARMSLLAQLIETIHKGEA
jgi:hypothetical protein